METPTRSRKTRSAGRTLFWVFSPLILVLFIALLLFAALALFGFSYDDQAALLARTPMRAQERFAFHAAERTVDIAVDASDAAFALTQTSGFDPEMIAAQLEGTGLVLEQYGVRFDDGAYVTLLLRAFGFIPVPIRLDADVSAQGSGDIRIEITRAHITRLFSVPMETLRGRFNLDLSQIVFTIPGAELHPRMASLRSVSFAGGCMILTCDVGGDLFREVLEDSDRATFAAYYIDEVRELTVFNGSAVAEDGMRLFGESFTKLLKELEANPGMIEEVRINCLALANAYRAEQAFAGTKGAFLTRFLPNVTQEAVAARRDEIFSVAQGREALLRKLLDRLNNLYFHNEIAYGDTRLLNLQSGETLALSWLTDDFTPYESFLSEGDTRVMFCHGDIQNLTFGFSTPLERMPREEGVTFLGIDEELVHMIVLLTRTANGEPAFVYLFNNGRLTSVVYDTIAEENYALFMGAEFVPSAAFGGGTPQN